MRVLHIGGVADGESTEVDVNVTSELHSFKKTEDFVDEPSRRNIYELRKFMVKDKDGVETSIEAMVWDELDKDEVRARIERRLNVQIVQ